MQEQQAQQVLVKVGVDLGAESTKVVLGEDASCEIVRNDVGNHTFPTVVAMLSQQQPRLIGEKPTTSSKQNVVLYLNRLLHGEELVGNEQDDNNYLEDFFPSQIPSLWYNGEPTQFTTAALLGMFLSKVKQNAIATYRRLESTNGNNNDEVESSMPGVSLALVCPPEFTSEAQQEWMDAAYAAGVQDVQLVDRSVAYQAAYARKFPQHTDKYVMIVDMGHTETTVSVLGPEKTEEEKEGEETEKEEVATEENSADAKNVQSTMKVLACRRQKGLGAGVVDVRLWKHFQSTKLQSLTPTSRAGHRLLAGMTKLKQLLSQLPEGSVTVETVGPNDTDVTLEANRQLLVEVCSKDVQALTNLIQETFKAANVEPSQLYSVEVVGGGCRMPWVKKVIEQATKMNTLSYTLDDTSAALGAALNPCPVVASRTAGVDPTDEQLALRSAEETMAKLDHDLRLRSGILNQMESHILGLRSAKHEKHGDLLPGDLFTYLDALEDWLFSTEAEEASYDALQSKWQEVRSKTDELSKSYNDKVEAERSAKEAEMEAEAKQAQKEREGQEDGDEEDHDNRRLPKKRRMEIVMKNKNEGGELFSGGNYKFAAARYAKALSHCAKFVDLSPEDQEEVNTVKLTLNMNLALAYLKMKNVDQALRYANDALVIDENHTKALYRRASVYYEKKNWDGASKDVKKALKMTPDDKALLKLQEKVEGQLKRQKLKEKKMAQKMFG